MKEDKLDKEIAASLKKKLIEASVPYELGAWEGFQKKRALRKRRAIGYWASGIAASLLLLAVGLNSVDLSENKTIDPTEVITAETTEGSGDEGVERVPSELPEEIAENLPSEIKVEPKSESSVSDTLAEEVSKPKPQVAGVEPKVDESGQELKALASIPERTQREEKSIKKEEVKTSPEKAPISPEKNEVEKEQKSVIEQAQLVAKSSGEEKQPVVKIPEETPALSKVEEQLKPTEEKNFVAENELPIISKDKTYVGLGMGVSPGFGGSQASNSVTSASTIGLGMLVDINLPGKLVIGSGVGLNYLNQVNEMDSFIQAYGNSYPQTDKIEVRQMQIEMPVFLKYPITRNNSISLQAGFSNYYALNQKAGQEFTANSPVPSYSANSLGQTSFSIQNRVVQESSVLESKDGRFYPFATLNLGVNLRILETEGASYVIMPFYNYQVKQISGYGDTYGLFGASFKVNFGGK